MKESPEDPFAHYALILEKADGLPDSGLSLWMELEKKFPDYLPLYYQSGQAALKMAQSGLAVELWKKGLKLARLQNNQHAASELQSAIMNSLMDNEDE